MGFIQTWYRDKRGYGGGGRVGRSPPPPPPPLECHNPPTSYVIMRSDVKYVMLSEYGGVSYVKMEVADVQRCVSYVIMRSDVKVL